MQDIYSKKDSWKGLLIVAGLIIMLVTLFYSQYLANKLQEKERNDVELFAEAVKTISADDFTGDASLVDEIFKRIHDIPVILEDERGNLEGHYFIKDSTITNQVFLADQVQKIEESGYEPIDGPPGYADTIYYKNSPLYNRIKYFPLITLLMLGAYGLFGYYLFSSARRSEQNRVWVGMAKETAHQLGTPISAIMAWIEHLKEHIGSSPEQQEIIEELTKDVKRLDLVADRFSKIGSAPKLIKTDLYEELEECKSYMAKRASKKIKFDFEEGSGRHVMINKHLFDWVIENLIRNALDAMGPNGTISTKVYEENDYFCVDLSDTGKGILSSKFKTVFQPGYSTKQRGWGLGLSLAKRIIENYHSGKIFVKSSIPDEKTTFTIKLPKAR